MSDPDSDRIYPRDLEALRITKSGLRIFLRPIKQDEGPVYKAFLESLSDESIYSKFFRHLRFTDDFVGKLSDVDYVRRMVILAFAADNAGDPVLGMGRYTLSEKQGTAEVDFAVRDEYQGLGIGRELVLHLIRAAKKRGLKGFTAQVMVSNSRMLHLFREFEGEEYEIRRTLEDGVFHLTMDFHWSTVPAT